MKKGRAVSAQGAQGTPQSQGGGGLPREVKPGLTKLQVMENLRTMTEFHCSTELGRGKGGDPLYVLNAKLLKSTQIRAATHSLSLS